MVVFQQLYTCKKYFLCGTTFGAYQNTKYIHMHENISTFFLCVSSILQECKFKFLLSYT